MKNVYNSYAKAFYLGGKFVQSWISSSL